jgi:hypothetical protein
LALALLGVGFVGTVAERMFNELPYDGFFIEWEDIKREGGNETLRFVPKGKMVIMGIVNTKVAEVEPADSLVRKIESAASVETARSPRCFRARAPNAGRIGLG